MEERRPLSPEFLVGWHDQMFETAKRILRQDGFLQPLVWMLTYPELVPPKFHAKLVPLEKGSSLEGADLVCAVLPLSYSDGDLYNIIVEHVLSEEGRERLAEGEAMLRRLPDFTEKKMHGIMVRATLERWNWVEADLIALRIRETLQASGALAYIKQDDAWHVQLKEGEKREDHPRSLAEDPAATECIISELEHWGGMRIITQPYHRRGRRRGEGKVKSFGDPIIKAVPRNGDGPEKYSGRFTWMLSMDKAEAEGAH